MLGWFKPECPVDAAAKQWVEQRLLWLSAQFGRDVFVRRAVILPTREFFPNRVDGSEGSVRKLLDQVCRYMDADPHSVQLQLFTANSNLWLVNEEGRYLPTHAAGLYDSQPGRTVIHVETAELLDLEGLVGTIAHELAHLRLLGEKRLAGLEFDNELLTDLTVVFHGLGVFVANSPRNWDSQYDKWPGSNLRCPEYMTPPMFGYALAHAAWCRGEEKPAWATFLRGDSRACFKQGLRFLQQTGDSQFSPQPAV